MALATTTWAQPAPPAEEHGGDEHEGTPETPEPPAEEEPTTPPAEEEPTEPPAEEEPTTPPAEEPTAPEPTTPPTKPNSTGELGVSVDPNGNITLSVGGTTTVKKSGNAKPDAAKKPAGAVRATPRYTG